LNDHRIHKKEKIEIPKNNDLEALKRESMSKGMAIGMVLFMPFGLILSVVIGSFAFIGLGIPLGVSVGVAIGEDLFQRRLTERGNESN
jgi:hypothetical protein